MRITQKIREAIATKVDSLAKFKIYSYTKLNISDNDLPAVVVTTTLGSYENGADDCSLDVRVEIRDKQPKIENVLDSHAEQVEPLFPIGETLGGLVEYMKPESFDYVLDAESNIGVIGLNFNIKYEV